MATYRAIAATGQAILNLLANSCPMPEFSGARFEMYKARDFQKPMEEGISLYLYHVTPSAARRNLPPRVTSDGRKLLPPVAIDLHYLITAWGKDPVKQQRLLGWAIRTLEDTPTLPAGLLNQPAPETDTFGPEETVQLMPETLSLTDLNYVWDMAQDNQQPSVIYAARMVLLDSEQEIPEGGPVQTRVFQVGKVVLK